jgi:hypothetical protein
MKRQRRRLHGESYKPFGDARIMKNGRIKRV